MKLCFLANAASIHTQRWASHFQQCGYEVTVLSLTRAEIPGVFVRYIGPSPDSLGRLAYLIAVPAVRAALRETQPDIVHAHYAGGYGMIASLAGFRPLVLTAWGSDVLVAPQSSRLFRRIIEYSLRRANLVTSMGHHMTAAIRGLGVPAERILTLPFGVNTEVFHPGLRESRADSAAAPLIVSTRHLEPVYNVGLLIEALPSILAHAPSTQTVIIGDGSQRAALEARVRELNLATHVSFIGKINPGQVAAYLARATVFVSTSRSDGNNISLNEAMACGAFPVVTDIAANREWVEHGRNGFLAHPDRPADLADGVLRAIASPELRRSAAAGNWAIVQRRASWAGAMEKMDASYRGLLKPDREAPRAAPRLTEVREP